MSIKAYKAFNADLTCRDFQYEIGKTYTMDEKPIPCERGYHACPELEDVFGYYNPTNKIRICEVEMNGINIKHDDKIVTNSITILKEIDYKSIFDIYSPNNSEQMMAAWYMDVEDLSKYLDHYNTSVRTIIANRGLDKHLDVLVKDKNSYVRAAVAERGRDKDLDILIKDLNDIVLLTVIEQCRPQDLDVFVHSSNPYIRMKVAQQGRDKDLDILVNDDNYVVRAAVAAQGRPQDLDILVHDENPDVRAAVAMQGRDKDLDVLVNDDSYIVSMAVAGQKHRKDLDIYIRAIVSHKLKEIHITN